MTTRARAILMAWSILSSGASASTAQVVLTPFAAVNVSTTPGFLDLDDVGKDAHGGVGLSVALLSAGWIGFEAETVFTPSAFSGHDLVESSGLFTATGGVLLTAPVRWGRLVRPYASLEAGIAHIDSVDVGRFFVIDS